MKTQNTIFGVKFTLNSSLTKKKTTLLAASPIMFPFLVILIRIKLRLALISVLWLHATSDLNQIMAPDA